MPPQSRPNALRRNRCTAESRYSVKLPAYTTPAGSHSVQRAALRTVKGDDPITCSRATSAKLPWGFRTLEALKLAEAGPDLAQHPVRSGAGTPPVRRSGVDRRHRETPFGVGVPRPDCQITWRPARDPPRRWRVPDHADSHSVCRSGISEDPHVSVDEARTKSVNRRCVGRQARPHSPPLQGGWQELVNLTRVEGVVFLLL